MSQKLVFAERTENRHPVGVFKQGRSAALAGKEIFSNPWTGENAEDWRKGYRAGLAELAQQEQAS